MRHVPAPYTPDPLEVRLPLRILGLVASPRGLATLDVDAEMARLTEALAGPLAQGLVEVVWAPAATWAAVHARLLAGEWHVLHFVGHGDYDTRTSEGLLALVGGDGLFRYCCRPGPQRDQRRGGDAVRCHRHRGHRVRPRL